jgi:hypothetical protein
MEDISEHELAQRVADHLRRAYPLEESPPVIVGEAKRTHRGRRLGSAAALAAASAVVGASLYAVHANGHPEGQATGSNPTQTAATDWVKQCFIHWEAPRSQDADYEGLALADASSLANSRGEQLVFIGADGSCVTTGSNVAYRNSVAVALDRGSLQAGIPRNAVIIFANSNPNAVFDGWNIR